MEQKEKKTTFNTKNGIESTHISIVLGILLSSMKLDDKRVKNGPSVFQRIGHVKSETMSFMLRHKTL